MVTSRHRLKMECTFHERWIAGESLIVREDKHRIYTPTLPKTVVPGGHAFELVLEWTDPRTGRVHREERIEEWIAARR